MAAIHVKLLTTTSVIACAAAIRVHLATTEAAVGNYAAERVHLSTAEAAVGNVPHIRVKTTDVETAVGNYPNMRTAQCVVEELMEVLEPRMSTVVFPGIDPATGLPAVLLGLAFDVKKSPQFSGKVVEHTSGAETATSYWQNPKWNYSVTFDYLPDYPKAVGDSDIRKMMGFFLAMNGRFQTWLFNDPDDNTVTAQYQYTFDGVTTQFYLVRAMGGYYEPIGQLQTGTLTLWLQADEAKTIPATPGPYTVTVNHASTITSLPVTIKAGATTFTQVSGAPGVNQFSQSGGTFTFNAANQNTAITINYQYQVDPSQYTFTSPNIIVMGTAPVANAIMTATFNYYFVCRFLNDITEFNKFANKLWQLNQLDFRSVPQA